MYIRTKRLLFFIIGDTVTIGDVSFKLKTPKNPELVPQNYSKDLLSFWSSLFKKFLLTQSPHWLYWNDLMIYVEEARSLWETVFAYFITVSLVQLVV